eukprot:1339626-Rhodomonas_salina.2
MSGSHRPYPMPVPRIALWTVAALSMSGQNKDYSLHQYRTTGTGVARSQNSTALRGAKDESACFRRLGQYRALQNIPESFIS